MKIYDSMLETIGKTPLVRLKKIEEKYNIENVLLAKVEMFNPSGSVKVRPARNMILNALHENLIDNDTVIIEATSGNMGVALAFVCAVLNLRFIAVMPENMSIERRQLIKAYGAEIVLTKPELGMKGASERALELKSELNGFIPSQFDNVNNPKSHFLETANEILSDTNNLVDIVFCGIGSAGTITGVGRKLKEVKDVLMVGIEPAQSPLLTKGVFGPHKISGIGANFVPGNLDFSVVDEVVCVCDEDAFFYSRELAKEEGLFVGISSGAALAGVLEYLKNNKVKDKVIVVILPDTGERYLSTGIIDE